ncbi:MAG: lamin tail domain-containing protein [bacterium]|nr:lamin tail domain-containing protein [bacterium]
MKKSLVIIAIVFTLLPIKCLAVNASDVIINEVAWMGTAVSYNDEWIELYNNGEAMVNLDGWALKADDGSPEINLSGTIPSKGFFLLERTDDNTVLNIPADLIYKGALGNDGENLKLFDNSNNIVDQIIFLDAWPAGDNETKETMQKINSSWQTAEATPKKENQALPADEGPEVLETRSLELYPKGIIFNEILASPDGPDGENEWIEIYNENDFEINLSGWQIKDGAGKITIYTLNKKIPALGYLVFSRPETKITLNNDGDELFFFNPNKEIINSIIFNKAPLNQSYSRTSSGWAWNSNLTPGEKNIITMKQVPSVRSLKSASVSLSGISAAEEKPEDGPQNISDINLGNLAHENKNSVFLIAFAVALFCSIAFLIVKGNLKDF